MAIEIEVERVPAVNEETGSCGPGCKHYWHFKAIDGKAGWVPCTCGWSLMGPEHHASHCNAARAYDLGIIGRPS